MIRRLWGPVLVLLALVGAGTVAAGDLPSPAPGRSVRSPTVSVPIGEGAVLGDVNAPVTIVEFSDYGCPFCRLHYIRTFPDLRREYVDAGHLRYVFRDAVAVTGAPESTRAAEAARCAGEQGRFWEMQRELFVSRQAAGTGELRRLARLLPLDAGEFDACLADRTYAHAVRRDFEDARRLGVAGTPTFFIGRSGADGAIEAIRLDGARPTAEFRRLIDRMLTTSP